MRLQRVETRDGFQALRERWGALAREGGQTSPFLSHDWFGCCWSVVGSSSRPEVLVVEDGGEAVGLLPLVRWKAWYRKCPARFLGVLSAPDTPFVDLVTGGCPEPVLETVMAHLASRRDWDVFALRGLRTESATLKALEAWLAGRFRWRRELSSRAPYVAVSGGWDEFLASKSQRFKKTIRNVRNRLSKAGHVTVEEHRQVPVGSEVFEDLLDVSRRSWKAEARLAIATMPGMVEFFRELTDRANRNGWLRLWVLRLDGRSVATEYQIEAHGRVHALRADVDSHLPPDLSPGTYLSGEILRALFERDGTFEYDMGPGENEYKARWASGVHESVDILVFRPGLFGTALSAVDTFGVPLVRRLRGERIRQ